MADGMFDVDRQGRRCKIGLCGMVAERFRVRTSNIVPSGRSQLQWILHFPLLFDGEMHAHVGFCKRAWELGNFRTVGGSNWVAACIIMVHRRKRDSARREARCREIWMPEQAAKVMVGQLWQAWSGRGLAHSDQ